MPRAEVLGGALLDKSLLSLEPEPEPARARGNLALGREASTSGTAGAQEWTDLWSEGLEAGVAASLSRLRAEWISQRPVSSPVRHFGDIDASSAKERLSVDEWCRIARRCGLQFRGGLRKGLEGIAQRDECKTLSFDEVAAWYSTYSKRSTLADDDAHEARKTRVSFCILGLPCCVLLPEGHPLSALLVRAFVSIILTLLLAGLLHELIGRSTAATKH